MQKLLDADWYRFARTCKLIWVPFVLLAIVPALLSGEMPWIVDSYNSTSALVALIALPICIAFYSQQFTEGTIRNRLICGGHRSAIYFSALLMGIGICLMLLAAAVLSIVLVVALSPDWVADNAESLWTLTGIWLLDTALCLVTLACLGHMIVTFTQSRLTTFIWAAVILLAMVMASAMLVSALSAAPMLYDYKELPDGTIVQTTVIANPRYVSGPARDIACLFRDALPTSGLVSRSVTFTTSLENALRAHMVRWTYWIIESVIFCIIGCLTMIRRDFK